MQSRRNTNEKHVTAAPHFFLCDLAPLRLCVSILCFFIAESAMRALIWKGKYLTQSRKGARTQSKTGERHGLFCLRDFAP
jgi:hypothetical protein